jgi:hypothetical protein
MWPTIRGHAEPSTVPVWKDQRGWLEGLGWIRHYNI